MVGIAMLSRRARVAELTLKWNTEHTHDHGPAPSLEAGPLPISEDDRDSISKVLQVLQSEIPELHID
jgi:hypothetical protein